GLAHHDLRIPRSTPGEKAERAAAEAVLEPCGRQTRAQGPAAGALRAARQAEGARGRDRPRSRAARGSRKAADESARRGECDGLLSASAPLEHGDAAGRAVRAGPRSAA